MKKRVLVSASVIIALVVTSCGDDGSVTSTDAVADQLAGVCRTIGRGIGNLDAATSLDEVQANASDASALYESGLNELKKVEIPTNDRAFADDVEDLIASFEDQLDTLDAIVRAARDDDQAAVDSRISRLSDQAAESNDLADSLDVSRCQLDPVFEAAPPTTEPDVPLTLPTLPEETFPVQTFPIDTSPIETVPIDTVPVSNKVVVSSADMVPLGDYTFADAPVEAIESFHTLLDLAPSMAAQSGLITVVDVIDLDGLTMGRVFAFEADIDPLTPGSFEEVTPYFTGDVATTPMTIGTQTGVTWSDPDGTAYYLLGVSNVVLWGIAPTADLLVPALQAWGESVSQ